MGQFRVGQKVVCIKPQSPYTVMNEIYTVTDILKCNCGNVQISYGICHNKTDKILRAGCPVCEKDIVVISPYWFSNASRFRPLDHAFAEEVIKMITPKQIEV